MDPTSLTQSLIRIPSFVDKENNESSLAEFIILYIKKNIPWLKVYKQKVEGDRFNVIAYNSTRPKVVFISHMDTVFAAGILKERLNPKIDKDKLIGLGSADMKGGLACSICAVEKAGQDIPVCLIFDCDEEYYFKGINVFTKEYLNGNLPLDKTNKPEIVIFPEPSDLLIGIGCRGCVELEIILKGKTAHAGRSNEGINAIEQGVLLVGILKEQLSKNKDIGLKYTSVNLASINGGIEMNGEIVSRANSIADIAKIVLDIRTGSRDQDAKRIISMIKRIGQTLNLEVKGIETKLDQSPFVASKEDLGLIETAISNSNVELRYQDDLSNSGYGEFAIVGSKLGWNAINFGPGPCNRSHKIDEYVNVSDLNDVTEVYCQLLKLLKTMNMKK